MKNVMAVIEVDLNCHHQSKPEKRPLSRWYNGLCLLGLFSPFIRCLVREGVKDLYMKHSHMIPR